MLFAVKGETIKMGKLLIIHIFLLLFFFNLLSIRFFMSMDHGKLANLCLFVVCKMGYLSLPSQCTCWFNCSFVHVVGICLL